MNLIVARVAQDVIDLVQGIGDVVTFRPIDGSELLPGVSIVERQRFFRYRGLFAGGEYRGRQHRRGSGPGAEFDECSPAQPMLVIGDP